MTSYLAVEAAVEAAPYEWRRTSFKRVTNQVKHPNKLALEPLLSLSSSGTLSTRTEMGGLGRQAPSDSTILDYWTVRPDQIVVNPMWLVGGSIGVSRVSGAVSPAYRVYSLDPSVLPRYLHYLLRGYPYMEQYRLLGRGDTTFDRSVGREDFEGLPILVPPMQEQRRIADFLDEQVALLDDVREMRERQIGLARERLAVAVEFETAKASFPRRKLRHVLLSLRDGTHTPPPRVSEGVPILTAKNVRNDQLEFTESDTYVSPSDADKLDHSIKARPGDVFLSIKGARLGRPALVTEGLPRFTFERNLALMRPNSNCLLSQWLYFCLKSQQIQDQISLGRTFSALPGIYLGALGELIVPVPSRTEQAAISSYLEQMQTDHALLESRLGQHVKLLGERRRSLIAAAVTGHLDVTTARRVA